MWTDSTTFVLKRIFEMDHDQEKLKKKTNKLLNADIQSVTECLLVCLALQD